MRFLEDYETTSAYSAPPICFQRTAALDRVVILLAVVVKL